jgi:hypothetical protein
MEFSDFVEDLVQGVRDPQSLIAEPRYGAPGNTIEELSHWCAFRPQEDEPAGREIIERSSTAWNPSPWSAAPLVNPFKGVGRNDPCPCGSGQKFKKCCLSLTQEAYADA